MNASQYTNELLADTRFMQGLYQRAQSSLCYSDAEYLELNPDVAGLNLPPFIHCCHFAGREKRPVSKFFEPAWYQRQYCAALPDCNPVLHFFSYGIFRDFRGTAEAFSPQLLAAYARRYFDRVEAVPFLDLPWQGRPRPGARLAEQTHLVFVAHELLPTGGALTLLQAMQELAKTPGLTLWSLLLRPGPLESDFCAISQALPLYQVNRATGYPLFSAMQILQGLAALPGRRKCLIPNTITIPKYFSSLAGLYGIPALPWLHELPGFLQFYWENNEIYKICQESGAVMTSSRFGAEKLAGYLREQRVDPAEVAIEVTGTPVTSAALKLTAGQAGQVRQELGLPAAGPLVLGCGYVSQVKGTDIFARVAGLAARRPDITFAWAGGASTEADQQLREDLKASARQNGAQLHFLGQVENLWPLYAASSLFLCTSRLDSFPRVVVEAKLAGLPVVCLGGNNGAVECLVPPGDAIIYREDPAELLRAVLQRLPQPGETPVLPTPQPNRDFSPARVAESICDILGKHAFAGSKRPGPGGGWA